MRDAAGGCTVPGWMGARVRPGGPGFGLRAPAGGEEGGEGAITNADGPSRGAAIRAPDPDASPERRGGAGADRGDAAAADWTAGFPGLASLAAEVRAGLVAHSRLARVPAGTVIFGPGKAPENLLLLVEGSVRVQQTAEGGREVVLYRVGAGESCVLTTACLLGYEGYPAEGIAETEVRAVMVPRGAFEDLIVRSAEFRRFVFAAYARRITDLIRVIDDIAFRRIDVRLSQRLLDLAGTDGTLHATHQDLALELGTAREVVSRQLHEFQRRGWVALGRAQIRLVEPSALRRLAGE
jgi:CRP/FNR family transcriptional regulator, anaerobic regulatory protein